MHFLRVFCTRINAVSWNKTLPVIIAPSPYSSGPHCVLGADFQAPKMLYISHSVCAKDFYFFIFLQFALRIMDVFLNEGHKVLYRVAIGIMKMYKDHFLSLTDPVTLLQILKDISRRTYTIEDIFNVSFSHFLYQFLFSPFSCYHTSVITLHFLFQRWPLRKIFQTGATSTVDTHTT